MGRYSHFLGEVTKGQRELDPLAEMIKLWWDLNQISWLQIPWLFSFSYDNFPVRRRTMLTSQLVGKPKSWHSSALKVPGWELCVKTPCCPLAEVGSLCLANCAVWTVLWKMLSGTNTCYLTLMHYSFSVSALYFEGEYSYLKTIGI